MRWYDYRVDGITVYVDEEVINYIDVSAKNILASSNPMSADTYRNIERHLKNIGDRRTVDEYLRTTRLVYTGKMFIEKFYHLFNDLCDEGVLIIYITLDMLKNYFKGLNISYYVDADKNICPKLNYDSVSFNGLKEYELKLNKQLKGSF